MNDPIWLMLVKGVLIFVVLVLLVLFTIWYERRVVAIMQVRPGPNRNGPFGLLQSLADGLKLAFKEDTMPRTADKVVFIAAPVIAVTCAFTALSVIPFGPEVSVFGVETALQGTDFEVSVLVILACSALGVYGIVLAGWASGSAYSLLGALRAAAQVISYEIALGLAVLAVFFQSKVMSTGAIVEAQAEGIPMSLGGVEITLPGWYFIVLAPSFVIFVIAMVGETNRAPFDLPEAESELVAGFATEYSSLKYASFFLAEYVNMVTMSALCVTLFLGGWAAPFPDSWWPGANEGFMPLVWFFGKVLAFLFFYVWLRGTLPRLRYDQFMNLGWKVLVPVSLVWLMVLAAMNIGLDTDNDLPTRIAFAGGAAIVVMALIFFWPARKEYEVPAEPDTGLGGFPVPPLDLAVPPNPRSLRQLEPATALIPGPQASPGESSPPVNGSRTTDPMLGSQASPRKEE